MGYRACPGCLAPSRGICACSGLHTYTIFVTECEKCGEVFDSECPNCKEEEDV